MERMIRWGVLSTANIASKQVLPAIVDASKAELVAIGSANIEKREAIASAFRIPNQYDSYEGVLADPDVEAVYIPLPNSLHKKWVIKAAEAGKHILVEKPIALSIQDAEEMFEACEKHGVLLMEAFMYQFHPEHAFVKALIQSGELGDIQLMRSAFTFNIGENADNNIRMNPELGGGSIFDVGCYCLHSIRYLLDTEPKEIYVQGHIHPEHGVDMSAQGVLKLENGVQAMFDCGFTSTDREKYEIIGSKGSVEVTSAYRPDKQPGGEAEILIKVAGKPVKSKKLSGNPYILEVEHLSSCILKGHQPSYTPEQSIKNLKTILAAYASLKSQEPIEL